MAASSNTRVMVYGSLKRGYGNHRLLERGKAEFKGLEVLRGPYRMVSLGGFPGVVREPDRTVNNHIIGEVYEVDVDTLHALDLLEGHPEWYTRQKVVGEHGHGKCWVYILPQSYLENETVQSGCWRPETGHEPNEEERAILGRNEDGAACA